VPGVQRVGPAKRPQRWHFPRTASSSRRTEQNVGSIIHVGHDCISKTNVTRLSKSRDAKDVGMNARLSQVYHSLHDSDLIQLH